MSHHEPRRLDPEQLSTELGWLRSLARQLVRDDAVADDLVQDTLVVALERGRGERSWLAGVIRNLDLRRRRGEGRRAVRERHGARPEQVDGPGALQAELQAQADLVQQVLALDEPYRHTLMRRFYRDQSPQAIATEDGVSVNTVNSRLQRGLAKLRERMDAEYGGDRSAWCIALMPLVERASASAVPFAGSLLTMKAALLACSAAAVATALIVFPIGSGPRADVARGQAESVAPGALEALAAVPSSPVSVPGPAGLAPSRSRAAVVAPPASEPSSAEPVEATSLFRLEGRVVDVEGRFRGGVELAARRAGLGGPLATPGESLTSASDGTFRLSVPVDQELELVADEPYLVTVQVGAWGPGAIDEPIVVVADKRRVAGRVIDGEGQGIEGVRLALHGPADLTSRIGIELGGSRREYWSSHTDRFGRFEFDSAPAFVDGLLELAHSEYDPRVVTLPQRDVEQLELTLKAPALLGELAIHGRVLAASGQPVPGAMVNCGSTVVVCDEAGGFTVDPVRALGTATLVAVAPGQLPARLERPAEPAVDSTGWPEFLTLTLGGPALAIEGRLVDTEGEPVAGARVWARGPDPFGAVGPYPISLEGLLAGQPMPDDAVASQRGMPTAPGDETFGWYSWRGEPDAMWPFVRTDADGRFRLEGLQDRSYVLSALVFSPLHTVNTDPVPAGSEGVRLTVALEERVERVRGRVVDELGEPLAGISIAHYEVPLSPSREVLGGRTEMNLLYSSTPAISDAEGAFELLDVPRDGLTLWLLGDGVLPTPEVVEGPLDAEGLVLELPCRRRLQVERVSATPADSYAVLDGAGASLPLYEIQVGRVMSFERGALAAGRSSVVSVGLASRTLVLYDGEDEVKRLPLTLAAEGLTTVQF
ncbi:MAG: sigma-70 family RNA polymerase sigma factor [Planctomycetota bacterium]